MFLADDLTSSIVDHPVSSIDTYLLVVFSQTHYSIVGVTVKCMHPVQAMVCVISTIGCVQLLPNLNFTYSADAQFIKRQTLHLYYFSTIFQSAIL